ncbi:hypothetical protein ABZS66_54795 [Dactylosporangium sp. NPDC005572]|uniref:TY-Chap domain-containing protein n=1 Tax=Dactylosporangium sp. NPDC005572 TaxID=3156889 RepID=UPI0033BF52ED
MAHRWDETWQRLLVWTSGQGPSERLAAQILLSDGYQRVDPSHPLGGRDGKKDATMLRNGLQWIMAVYFPRGQQPFNVIKKKFVGDLAGVVANGVSGMAFVCNQEISLSERRDLDKAASGRCDIYHLERVVAILDQPKMRHVREQFLNIDAGVGDLEFADAAARGKFVRERIDIIAHAIDNLSAKPRWRKTTDHSYFILEIHGLAGFYAQFMRSVRGIYVELVSSEFLPRWHWLTESQEAMLVEEGWELPDASIPNFNRDFAFPKDRGTFSVDLARKVHDTLIHVYGIHETDSLEIRTSDD